MAEPSGPQEQREEAVIVRLLLLMTVATGIVDAVSILRLGHVFVANMTGNVVFLGFGLAGASGFSVSASLVALAAFLGAAALGGRVFSAVPRRLRALSAVAGSEVGLCLAAAAVAAASSGTSARYAMTILLAVAMGTQNAFARHLAVPDLTTTVLTLTLTGLAADRPDVRRPSSHTVRRVAAVVAMLAGAVGGATLVLHASTAWALLAAAALLAVVCGAARLAPGHDDGSGPSRVAPGP
jgi:uncharacterized membrane protein YoaK (UPF0700 family)